MAEHLECSELRHQILEEGILGQAWPQLAIRSDDELARVQEDGMFKVMWETWTTILRTRLSG